jgi:hypothetical protein
MKNTSLPYEGLPSSACSGVGGEIMDALKGLLATQCCHDDGHSTVWVWSASAESQLEAIVESRLAAVQRKWESDCRVMNGYAQLLEEAGLSPNGPELIKAVKRWENCQNDRILQSHEIPKEDH